jgi:hypothetical protein
LFWPWLTDGEAQSAGERIAPLQGKKENQEPAEEQTQESRPGAGEAMNGGVTMNEIQIRFLRIIGRHLRYSDNDLNDTDFVRKVIERFERERKVPIIDVNE